MALTEVIDDHVLARYRALADAEIEAFDEMEHAYEEGDRTHFEMDLRSWQEAIGKKLAFLREMGIEMPQPALS